VSDGERSLSPAIVSSGRFRSVMREIAPVAERFAAAGHRLYLVGGTVRDLVVMAGAEGGNDLDADVDLDATTTALPAEIKRLLQGWADAIWTQGERFGTIGAMKRVPGRGAGSADDASGSDGGATGSGQVVGQAVERVFEITTHRAEAYRGDSRKPEVAFSDDVRADLSRRDFTVNAMAIDVTSAHPRLVDPFGGEADLVRRSLRTPLTPSESFSDDPLRMLRAARFITRYELEPVPELVAAVVSMGERLSIVSAERIRDELDKLLGAASPAAGLRFVVDTGLVAHAVPELTAIGSETDTTEPTARPASAHATVADHAIAVVSGLPVGDETRRLTRWAALFTRSGAVAAKRRMSALRASTAHIEAIGTLVTVHDRLLSGPSETAWTDGEVRRLVRSAGRHRDEVVVLALATARELRPDLDRMAADVIGDFVDRVARLDASEDLDDLRPELDGSVVMRLLGLHPGRDVGDAMAFLTDLRLDVGPIGADEAAARLQAWWPDRAQQR
jgi:poly(A) polymerase